MPIARGREIASTRYRHHPDGPPQTERYRKRRCPTADSKAHAIDTAFGHGRPPVCFLSRQLESYRGGPRPPFHLDAILLSKCARNCTLPLNVELPNSLEKSGMSGVSTLTRSKTTMVSPLLPPPPNPKFQHPERLTIIGTELTSCRPPTWDYLYSY